MKNNLVLQHHLICIKPFLEANIRKKIVASWDSGAQKILSGRIFHGCLMNSINPNSHPVSIQRDLFYGYDTLMGNVSVLSHINFTHHKVTGRRDRAKSLPFKMESSGFWGFAGSNTDNPKISAEFIAPCYYINKVDIDTKLPFVGDKKWVVWICSFNVPMAPGKTRSIVCSARNFFQFSMPGCLWVELALDIE